MPVLVVGQLATAGGPKQVGFVNGISDNLYAFDVEAGKILWKKHWDYASPDGRRRRRKGVVESLVIWAFSARAAAAIRRSSGRLTRQGRRAVYFVSGDGMLHILNAADGTELEPPYMFFGGKGWALNLVGRTLWMADTYLGISIAAVDLDDPKHHVMTFNAGSGGAWGRRGAVVDSTGVAYLDDGRRRLRPDERSAPVRQQRDRRARRQG